MSLRVRVRVRHERYERIPLDRIQIYLIFLFCQQIPCKDGRQQCIVHLSKTLACQCVLSVPTEDMNL